MIGFATVENDRLFWGALSAIAVDIAMLLAAERLQREVTPWLVAGLVLASTGSVYSQALYMVGHTEPIMISLGAMWMQNIAQWLINARVLVLPFLLPAQVVIFSLASKGKRIVTEQIFDDWYITDNEDPKRGKAELCKTIYGLLPDAMPSQVAAVVGCSVATASRARGQ